MEREDEQESGLKPYLRIIRKRLWIVITIFVLTVIGTAIVSFKITPIYRATALMRIEKRKSSIVQIQDVYEDANWPYGMNYYETLYRLIRSKGNCKAVYEKLSLGKLEKYQNSRDPIGSFRDAVIVSPISDTFLVEVSYESEDRELAAKIANALSDQYVLAVQLEKKMISEDAESKLAEQIPKLKRKLAESETALREFEQEKSALSFEKRRDIIYNTLSSLNSKFSRTNEDIAAAKAKYGSVQGVGNTEKILTLPDVVNSPIVRDYMKEKLSLETQKVELAQTYRLESEQIKKVEQQIKVVDKMIQQKILGIAESIRISLEEKEREKEELKALLDEQERLAKTIDATVSKYESLKRDVERDREIYSEFARRQKEIWSSLPLDTSAVQIVDRAEVPVSPVYPKKKQNLILAAVLSILAGIAIVFLIEHLDDSIKNQEDLEKRIKLPLLGVVPKIKADGKHLDDTDLLAHRKPKSSISEAYRTIRTNLLYASPNQDPKTYLVTSAGPQEGKTTTAINLAITLAHGGKKILLVDSDLRRPRIHKTFNMDNNKGLTNCLVGQLTLEDLVAETEVENLSLLPSGPIPPNPAELLDSDNMKRLITEMKKSFDTVVFDSPPLIAVTDGAVLAAQSDGVIQVIWAGNTSWKMVEAGKKRIESAGAKVLGVILNNTKVSRSGDYHYYPYFKYYTTKKESLSGE